MFTVLWGHMAGIRKILVFCVKGDDVFPREIFPHLQSHRTGELIFIIEIFPMRE